MISILIEVRADSFYKENFDVKDLADSRCENSRMASIIGTVIIFYNLLSKLLFLT